MDERTTDPPPADASAPQPPVPRTGDDGKPVYDQEFFLALARCGKEMWNEWRERNNAVVTFQGVNFGALAEAINFSGYRFGDDANFSGSRFGARADFSDSVFGEAADLSGTLFGDRANFEGATFGNSLKFYGATFDERADFSGAIFGSWAYLGGAAFGDHCNFSGISFGHQTNFSSAVFSHGADFSGTVFGNRAVLSTSKFGNLANFRGTSFGRDTSFRMTVFGFKPNFTGLSIEGWKSLRSKLIRQSLTKRAWPEERRNAFLDRDLLYVPPTPDSFATIDFSAVRFADTADFSDRRFLMRVNFSGAQFDQPPIFDRCTNLDRVDFYGASVRFSGQLRAKRVFGWRIPELRVPGWTLDTEVALRLRRLRKIAEETKDHDFERDLYIEERKAERGMKLLLTGLREEILRLHWTDDPTESAPRRTARVLRYSLMTQIGTLRSYGALLWIGIMAGYWLLADYGRNFVRPLVALALSVPLLWWAYTAVLIPPTDPAKLPDFRRATWAFAISNAVPFVGALTLERDVKLTLLCGDRPIDAQHAHVSGQPVCVPIPGRRFQLLALAQSIFSALCVFFAGLALRNYFKLR